MCDTQEKRQSITMDGKAEANWPGGASPPSVSEGKKKNKWKRFSEKRR
jgi:hypothetical protein